MKPWIQRTGEHHPYPKQLRDTPALTHAGLVACVSSLETIPEDAAVSECSSGPDQESQVSLTSASVGKVLMDPSHEDASGTVQNSPIDVGIANANVLMDVRHETWYHMEGLLRVLRET